MSNLCFSFVFVFYVWLETKITASSTGEPPHQLPRVAWRVILISANTFVQYSLYNVQFIGGLKMIEICRNITTHCYKVSFHSNFALSTGAVYNLCICCLKESHLLLDIGIVYYILVSSIGCCCCCCCCWWWCWCCVVGGGGGYWCSLLVQHIG